MHLACRWGMPAWIVERFLRQHGEAGATQILAASIARPTGASTQVYSQTAGTATRYFASQARTVQTPMPSAATSFLNASARWLIACFSAGSISAKVFSMPLAMKIGDAAGQRPDRMIGPVAEMWVPRLIEGVINAFDLCRYYHILLEAPDGRCVRACPFGRWRFPQ